MAQWERDRLISEQFSNVPDSVRVTEDMETGALAHVYLITPSRIYRLMTSRNRDDIQEYLTNGHCQKDVDRLEGGWLMSAVASDEEWILCSPCQWFDVLELSYCRVGSDDIPVCKYHYFHSWSKIKPKDWIMGDPPS